MAALILLRLRLEERRLMDIGLSFLLLTNNRELTHARNKSSTNQPQQANGGIELERVIGTTLHMATDATVATCYSCCRCYLCWRVLEPNKQEWPLSRIPFESSPLPLRGAPPRTATAAASFNCVHAIISEGENGSQFRCCSLQYPPWWWLVHWSCCFES